VNANPNSTCIVSGATDRRPIAATDPATFDAISTIASWARSNASPTFRLASSILPAVCSDPAAGGGERLHQHLNPADLGRHQPPCHNHLLC